MNDQDKIFEEIRRDWQAVKSQPYSHDELRKMMYSSPAARFRRATPKQVLIFVARAALIIAIIVAFRLLEHWSTAVFALWGIFTFLDEHLGIRYLRALPQKNTFRESLLEMLTKVRRLALTMQLANTFIWVVLVSLFSQEQQLTTTGVIVTILLSSPLLLIANWWNAKKWNETVAEVNEMVNTLSEHHNLSTDAKL